MISMKLKGGRHRGYVVRDRWGFEHIYPSRKRARQVAGAVEGSKVLGPWLQAWSGRGAAKRYAHTITALGDGVIVVSDGDVKI